MLECLSACESNLLIPFFSSRCSLVEGKIGKRHLIIAPRMGQDSILRDIAAEELLKLESGTVDKAHIEVRDAMLISLTKGWSLGSELLARFPRPGWSHED